ncbi:MAG: outer membrane lipoprotein-sorting protein [Halieaceae bacterium]|nr:outer membrane lipoprotein-sorting protein [Halieaceae bacterium]
MTIAVKILLSIALFHAAPVTAAEPMDARQLVQAAMDHWRGESSSLENTMTIHRPTWERSLSMVGWTTGDETSLMRVTAPSRDAGNSTLLKDGQLWSYHPGINRIIKVPASMMEQSWMGSDFSNRDIGRSTDIVHQYSHRLLSEYERDGHTVHVVEATPLEHAPVVWGREVLHIRDDHILLEHQFLDQEDVLVKTMRTLRVEQKSGRSVATVMRMSKAGNAEEWTELDIHRIDFDVELPASLFTLSNLRNPRR